MKNWFLDSFSLLLLARKDGGISGWIRFPILAVILYLLISIPVGVWWSFEPDQPDVGLLAQQAPKRADGKPVTGYTTTATLIEVIDTLLHKPGGFIDNDKLPPGVWLDNMPNWEFGVMQQTRDLARLLRNDISRSQSQSVEDKALVTAETRLHVDTDSWMFPSAEGQYGQAEKQLRDYLKRLSDTRKQDAQFYARSDNLRAWLEQVEKRLGSISQRLSASVGQDRINTDLANDPAATQSTPTADEKSVQTSWLEIDNVFYEARGASWALLAYMRAIEVDFADVLQNKNAAVSVRQIIRELEGTQRQVWSPVIMNGGGFGMFANHSLVMASYLSQANAAIIDLRELLAQG